MFSFFFRRLLFLLLLISSGSFSIFFLLLTLTNNQFLPTNFPENEQIVKNGGIRSDVQQRGDFCVLYNFTVAQWLESREERGTEKVENQSRSLPPLSATTITLAVHSTLHYIHHIQEQALHWDGLISASVLVRPGEHPALPRLLALWHCSPPLRLRVSLHLVWRRAPFQPAAGCGLLSARQQLPHKFPCPPASELSKVLPGALPWSPMRYPINALRNIARLGTSPMSRVHLVADVENVFNSHFNGMVAKHVEKMVKNEPEGKVAYVIRRFEVDEGVDPLPRDPEQLQELFEKGLAFPFHSHHFPAGHHIPRLAHWFNQSLSGSVEVVDMGEIQFMNAGFEPQLIMPANAPLHFEPVPARLYDHQIIELCRAGFHLRLLSNVFNVHRGVKRELSEQQKVIKRIVAGQSWRLIRQFRAEMEKKYGQEGGDGGRRCPTFWRT